MRAYSTQITDQSKGRSAVPSEIPPDAPTARHVSLSPEDRDWRLAEIRLILTDAAPAFRARAAGESEAKP